MFQLTGNKEVKAQVRLGFRSVSGHHMTATRNMELTSKKAANPTFSTTECTLLIRKDGERTTVSSKGKQPRLPFYHLLLPVTTLVKNVNPTPSSPREILVVYGVVLLDPTRLASCLSDGLLTLTVSSGRIEFAPTAIHWSIPSRP
jgi:hypothetical protein